MKTSEIYSAYMYGYPHKTAYRPLENIDFSSYKRLLSDDGGSLYFHVPFCGSKCGYCNLFSVTGQGQDVMAAYISACETQIRQYDIDMNRFETLVVGGGDPSVLPVKQLHRLLSLAGDEISVCIEGSPNEIVAEKLDVLRCFNTTRVSIGVQSFIDTELDALKRRHSASSAKRALDLLKRAGFPCLNIDLIYGIPGQTVRSLESSVRQALEFSPDEIFLYPLYIRKGTQLGGQVANDSAYDMYIFARDYLKAHGYSQASMRQFTKRSVSAKSCGFESMLAIGCGGRSYIGNLHFCHPYGTNKNECLATICDFIHAQDKTKIEHGYILSPDEVKRRYVIKNLLYYSGVPLGEYGTVFDDFPVINQLVLAGYAEINADSVRLTPLGLSLSDHIGPMFISDEVKEKMLSW